MKVWSVTHENRMWMILVIHVMTCFPSRYLCRILSANCQWMKLLSSFSFTCVFIGLTDLDFLEKTRSRAHHTCDDDGDDDVHSPIAKMTMTSITGRLWCCGCRHRWLFQSMPQRLCYIGDTVQPGVSWTDWCCLFCSSTVAAFGWPCWLNPLHR